MLEFSVSAARRGISELQSNAKEEILLERKKAANLNNPSIRLTLVSMYMEGLNRQTPFKEPLDKLPAYLLEAFKYLFFFRFSLNRASLSTKWYRHLFGGYTV